MRKKRILLIGTFPPPLGGGEVSTLNLFRSRYWHGAGLQIEKLNTSAGDRVRLPDETLSGSDLMRGVRIFLRFLRALPGTGVVLLWANNRFICTLGMPIILFSLLARRPIVVKIFGSFIIERIEGYGGLRKRMTVGLLRRAACVMPQTRQLAEDFVNITGLDPGRVVQFPNFVGDDSMKNIDSEREFSGRCLFVGQIKMEKGIFDIIDAIDGRDRLSCDFYGQIVPRDRESFLERIERSSNCDFPGELEPEKVIDTMAGYDALLLPTYHSGEGYPGVVFQAFAAGVPVVTTDWKSIPEIVQDGVNGILVPVKSPEGIRRGIERLRSDPGLFRSIVRNAHGFIAGYTEEKVVRDLLIGKISGLISRE